MCGSWIHKCINKKTIARLHRVHFFISVGAFCASSPCREGNCFELKDTYRCECFSGFSGNMCDKGRNVSMNYMNINSLSIYIFNRISVFLPSEYGLLQLFTSHKILFKKRLSNMK